MTGVKTAPMTGPTTAEAMGESRVERCFAALKAERRGGLVVFVAAGDPDPETFFEILSGLPEAGVDGLIIVDLPPEEDVELCLPTLEAGLHWIRLATPTTDDKRLPAVLSNTSGFVYYVSIMGITGTRSASGAAVREAVTRLKRHTDLPVAVGFGIKTPEQAAEIAAVADAAIVGSAVIERLKAGLDEAGRAKPGLVEDVLGFVRALAEGVRKGRPG